MSAIPDQPMAGRQQRIDEYVGSCNSRPDVCRQYNVDVRDYVVLACINEFVSSDKFDLAQVLLLSPSTISLCLDNLCKNGLIRRSRLRPEIFGLTRDGIALIRKVEQ